MSFLFSLEKKYPKDFAKMLARVQKYANAKEAYELHGTSFKARAEKREKDEDKRAH